MTIQPIKNRAEIVELLQVCSLPTADLKTDQDCVFFGGYDDDVLISCVGVELYGDVVILRSLAVSPSMRKRGTGSALVRHVESFCKLQGVLAIYLLTTTAGSFFASLGYDAVARDSVPEAIKGSTQYSSVCPASATIMSKTLAAVDRVS